MSGDTAEITALLAAARAGDRVAADRVFPLIYAELRKTAARHMRLENPGHDLQPTALVHEAYLRLMQQNEGWIDRAHFFAVASRIMRNVLVDEARNRLAQKRGGGAAKVPLEGLQIAGGRQEADILAIDQALTRLFAISERQGQVVEMHFFAGLSEEEIAEHLGVSVRTVRRDWVAARAWLHAQLGG